MDSFLNNPTQVFLIIGAVCIAIEILLLGINGPLLFLGLGALIASGILALEFVSGYPAGISITCISAIILAISLWKPFKALQNKETKPDTSSDLIGQIVTTTAEVNSTSGQIRHSGINWNARIDSSETAIESFEKGDLVVIAGVNGNTLFVKAKP